MQVILNELEQVNKWSSYEDVAIRLKEIINTKEFKEFPRLRNRFYIEALAFYALNNWQDMPLHAQALVISRYPIFINKLAYKKTLKEYNELKQKIITEFNSLSLPICPILLNQCSELKNTITRYQYFAFFRDVDSHVNTAMTLEQCKEIANRNNKGLICIYLTYEISEDLLASIVVYNQSRKTNKLVDESVISKSKLIADIEPKIADREYDILIDREDCYICLDYGLSGFYSICDKAIEKKLILEHRVISCCSNDYILENMKVLFIHDYNVKELPTSTIQDEMKKIGDLISETWDDDKNKFIENIQFLKTKDYALYLYLYWIKKDDSIHTRYHAYLHAMKWISSS